MDEEPMTIQEVYEYLSVEADNTHDLRVGFIYRFAAWSVSFQPTETLNKKWEECLESDAG